MVRSDYLKVPDDVLWHLDPMGLVVFHLEMGEIYRFSNESKHFFEFFRKPRQLSEFLDEAELRDSTEAKYLITFCEELIAAGLLQLETTRERTDGIKVHYYRPTLLGNASHEFATLSH